MQLAGPTRQRAAGARVCASALARGRRPGVTAAKVADLRPLASTVQPDGTMEARTATPTAKLREYRAKRSFDRTPEPSGEAPRARGKGANAKAAGALGYVIQKHAASHLHYDFRLELDGVLLSWSVPKGPTLDPGTRRLAMRTEDHPLDYADFEGIIPAGQYGGGTVIVWDRGTWTPESDAAAALKKGRLTFDLHGEKLRGRWHLVRTRPQGTREAWLLFKGNDDEASTTRDIVAERPESAITGRTLDDVKAAPTRVWQSNRADHGDKKAPTLKERVAGKAAARAGKKAGKEPGELESLVASLPVGFPLTNLDKVLYPETGTTKAAYIAYLAVMAEVMLPQLANRPLTLVRCPDGRGKCFFQKHIKDGTPPPVKPVPIAEDDGTVSQYMQIDDLAGLVALAQMGALEIHTWGAHTDKVERPDLLVFDLDPDEGLAWSAVVDGAVALRARLAELGLDSWVKTTGGKGLHVVAPVERRIGWDDFKAFAKGLVEGMEAATPKLYTTNMAKARRKGKIFLDYLRNGRGATFIAPYSPRNREGAPVATPITWQELEAGVDPRSFTIATVPRRVAALRKEPWADLPAAKQTLTARARREVGA
jgi:bifunctional non-homologous end joining protein LigD